MPAIRCVATSSTASRDGSDDRRERDAEGEVILALALGSER
jgi:hypothetical protein